jgi:Na+/melibiose symporter-like transporter
MMIAVISFLWAFFITPETAYLFYIICALTGGAYGADLSIPPALYADMVDDVNEGGIYFAILNFINKFSLAIGAGIGLLIPGILGFDSAAGNASSASTNQQDFSVTSIAVVYCLIPCAFKLLSAILLKRGDFDKAYKN